jgi:hypothetical protein
VHPRQLSNGDFVYGISSLSESLLAELADDARDDEDDENRNVNIGGDTN